MKIWLDDKRQAPEGWRLAKTASAAIGLLKKCKVTDISLDHDLGEGNGTGNDVLLWIEAATFMKNDYIPPKITIHSANVSAANKMRLGAERIEKEARGRKRNVKLCRNRIKKNSQ